MGIPKQPQLTDVEYQINQWAYENCYRELRKAEQRIIELESLLQKASQINTYDIKDRYAGLTGCWLLSRNHCISIIEEIRTWRRENVRK